MSETADELAKRTPPGQVLTTKWPVLTYGLTPKFNPKTWTFRCFGREHPSSILMVPTSRPVLLRLAEAGSCPAPAGRGWW